VQGKDRVILLLPRAALLRQALALRRAP